MAEGNDAGQPLRPDVCRRPSRWLIVLVIACCTRSAGTTRDDAIPWGPRGAVFVQRTATLMRLVPGRTATGPGQLSSSAEPGQPAVAAAADANGRIGSNEGAPGPGGRQQTTPGPEAADVATLDQGSGRGCAGNSSSDCHGRNDSDSDTGIPLQAAVKGVGASAANSGSALNTTIPELLAAPSMDRPGLAMWVQLHVATSTAAFAARAALAQFNPTYLVIGLLALGFSICVGAVLYVRREAEFGPRQEPQRGATKQDLMGDARSPMSARSPAPSPRNGNGCSPLSRRARLAPPVSRVESFMAANSLTSCVPHSSMSLAGQVRANAGDFATGPSSPQERSQRQLCPSLVVPSGMELLFAIREVPIRERQQTSLGIVDLSGQPLCLAIVDDVGPRGGIFLKMLDERPLAWVRMAAVPRASDVEVCWPSGEVFGVITRDEPVTSGRYLLHNTTGQRIFAFHGNFQEKAINVVNASGRLVCDTEPCIVDFDDAPHYQVRVAPGVDAGLLLCGLLAIDRLECAGPGRPLPNM